MLFFSIKFGERSEGADEIYIWIPQVPVAVGSARFFICVLHNIVLLIYKKKAYPFDHINKPFVEDHHGYHGSYELDF